MQNLDLHGNRAGRKESSIVDLWDSHYKRIVMEYIIFCFGQDYNMDRELLGRLRRNVEDVEVVADTVIGWLNSPIGRSFICEAFRVDIPKYGRNGEEAR